MLRVFYFFVAILEVSAQRPCCETKHGPLQWRNEVGAAVAASASLELLRDGHVYEVGVFTGNSMVHLAQQLNPLMIWGFDSFEGLPETGVTLNPEIGWHAGQYKDDPRHRLRHKLNGGRHGWVAGFYSDSLSPDKDSQVLAKGMKAASYIDIDCDLYESTRDALDFFFRNGLVVVGTVIGYDDWWVLPCGQDGDNVKTPLKVGEGRAHAEIARKYGVAFKCVSGPCFSWKPGGQGKAAQGCEAFLASSAWGVMFQVVSIDSATKGVTADIGDGGGEVSSGSSSNNGTAAASVWSPQRSQQHSHAIPLPTQHGFEMRSEEVAWFRANNDNCVGLSFMATRAAKKRKGAAAAKELESAAKQPQTSPTQRHNADRLVLESRLLWNQFPPSDRDCPGFNFDVDAVFTWASSGSTLRTEAKQQQQQQQQQTKKKKKKGDLALADSPSLSGGKQDKGSKDADSRLDSLASRRELELRFAMRSVFVNAPWVRTIFVVVTSNGGEDAYPEWLLPHDASSDASAHALRGNSSSGEKGSGLGLGPKVVVVQDLKAELFPVNFHRIPSLAEHWVHFHEGQFLGRPLPVSAFFTTSGKPKVGSQHDRGHTPKGKGGDDGVFGNAERRVDALLDERYKTEPRFRLLTQACPMTTGLMKLAHERFPQDFKTRLATAQPQLMLAAWVGVYEGLAERLEEAQQSQHLPAKVLNFTGQVGPLTKMFTPSCVPPPPWGVRVASCQLLSSESSEEKEACSLTKNHASNSSGAKAPSAARYVCTNTHVSSGSHTSSAACKRKGNGNFSTLRSLRTWADLENCSEECQSRGKGGERGSGGGGVSFRKAAAATTTQQVPLSAAPLKARGHEYHQPKFALFSFVQGVTADLSAEPQSASALLPAFFCSYFRSDPKRTPPWERLGGVCAPSFSDPQFSFARWADGKNKKKPKRQ